MKTCKEILKKYDQIVEVYRLASSTTDYLLKIVAPSINSYDEFQQKLISEIKYSQSFRTFNENVDSDDIIYKDLEDAYSSFKANRKEKEINLPPPGLYI